jgi:hypothetical protein
MKTSQNFRRVCTSTLWGMVGILIGLTAAAASAGAIGRPVTTADTTSEQRLATIQSRGDAEIERRLKTLGNLTTKIAATTKLNASDKTALSAEVASATAGLTALKTQLDGETTLGAARTDAQNILTEYRVYALVAPKVLLIATADGQQAVEAKLSALADKLQTRVTAAASAGKPTNGLQTALDALKAQVAKAQAVSSSVEMKLLPLQPSDYNGDHTILASYITQLHQAHADNQAAYNNAKALVAELKSL